eukprot:TRINITY_DN5273_c0_g1_i9.p1 TRINITY_DN5273_c0_g1~~TRINITY_DN5273_c0_g1_i9.p1  ORF type:complete len:1261 (-),score=384.31 TRINITY_DN5273_c0_g1_i9:290-4072(-)
MAARRSLGNTPDEIEDSLAGALGNLLGNKDKLRASLIAAQAAEASDADEDSEVSHQSARAPTVLGGISGDIRDSVANALGDVLGNKAKLRASLIAAQAIETGEADAGSQADTASDRSDASSVSPSLVSPRGVRDRRTRGRLSVHSSGMERARAALEKRAQQNQQVAVSRTPSGKPLAATAESPGLGKIEEEITPRSDTGIQGQKATPVELSQESLKAELEKTKQERDAALNQIQTASFNFDLAKAAMVEAKAKMDALVAGQEEAWREGEKAQDQLRELRARLSAAEESESKRGKQEELSQHASLRHGDEQSLGSLQKELEDELKALRSELELANKGENAALKKAQELGTEKTELESVIVYEKERQTRRKTQHDGEVSALREALANVSTANTALNATKISVRDSEETAVEEARRADVQKSEFEARLAAAEEEQKEHQRRHSAEVKSLHERLAEEQQQHTAARHGSETIEARHRDLEESLENAESEIVALKAGERAALEKAREVEAKKSEFESSLAAAEEEQKEHQEKHSAEVKSLHARLAEEQQQHAAARHGSETFEARHRDLEESLENAESEIVALKAGERAALEKAIEAEAKKSEFESRLAATKDEQQEDQARHSAEVKSLHARLAEEQQQHAAARHGSETIEARHRDLEESLENAESEVGAAKAGERAALEKAIEAEAKKSEFESRLAATKDEQQEDQARHSAEVKSLNDRLAEEQQQHAAARHGSETIEARQREFEQIVALSAGKDTAREQAREAEVKKSEFESRLAAAEEDQKEHQRRHSAEVKSLHERLAEEQQQHAAARHGSETIEARHRDLEESLENAESEIVALKAGEQAALEKAREVEAKKSEFESGLAATEDERKEDQARHSAEVKSLHARLAEEQQQHAAARHGSETIEARHRELDESLRNAESELGSVRVLEEASSRLVQEAVARESELTSKLAILEEKATDRDTEQAQEVKVLREKLSEEHQRLTALQLETESSQAHQRDLEGRFQRAESELGEVRAGRETALQQVEEKADILQRRMEIRYSAEVKDFHDRLAEEQERISSIRREHESDSVHWREVENRLQRTESELTATKSAEETVAKQARETEMRLRKFEEAFEGSASTEDVAELSKLQRECDELAREVAASQAFTEEAVAREQQVEQDVTQRARHLQEVEYEMERAIAAHRFVARTQLTLPPVAPPRVEEDSDSEDQAVVVKRAFLPTARHCQDFLFCGDTRSKAPKAAEATASSSGIGAHSLAWLQGDNEETF